MSQHLSIIKNYIKIALSMIFRGRFIFTTSNPHTCLLTFDDTLGDSHNKLLNLLKKYNIKAVFFLSGEYIQDNKQIIKTVQKAGHTIGNHTFNHDDITTLSYSQLITTLNNTELELKKIQESIPKIFRPPMGWLSIASFVYCILKGYKILLWSIGGTYKDVTGYMSAYQKGILLFHLWDISLEELDHILTDIQKMNIKFIEIKELLKITTIS